MGQKTNPSALRLYLNFGKDIKRKKSPYSFGANLHAHNFSKKLHLQFQIFEILAEIFTKSGFILSDFKLSQTQTHLQAFFSLYLRKNTSLLRSPSSSAKKDASPSLEKPRRLDWSSRDLFWQELSLNFIENLSLFFENLSRSQNLQLQFQPSFRLLQADPEKAEALKAQLRNFQNYPFFKDAIDILTILTTETEDKSNAELLARFLSIEVFNINNPQLLLDFLSNAFSILLPEISGLPEEKSTKTLAFSDMDKDKEELVFLEKKEEAKAESISKLFGVKIQIKGGLANFDRATALKFQIGSIPFNQLNASIDYAFHEVKAKRGVLGIKVWLHYI
jgi:hypothetical protein